MTKMRPSIAVFATSERHGLGRRVVSVASRAGATCAAASGGPAVAETGVVLDVVEIVVDIAELLPDALNESADICAVPLGAVAGDEVFSVNEVVDFAVTDVLSGAHREQRDDL